MSFLLYATSGAGTAELFVNWDYKDQGRKIQTEHVARSGRTYVYKWGSVAKIKFTVSGISSESMALVNSWWSSNTKLLFVESGSTNVFSCQLKNQTKPIDSYEPPYFDLFSGTIELGSY